MINSSEGLTASATKRDSTNINEFLQELNSVQQQLDNSAMLEKLKCRFLGGYFDDEDNFHQFINDDPNTEQKPLMNLKGFNIIEHYIDTNTCPNAILSNKNKYEINKTCLQESLATLKNLCLNHIEYEIDPSNIEFIILTCAGIAFSGQKRALGGETAKAINKIIKQIEQVIKEDHAPSKRKLF